MNNIQPLTTVQLQGAAYEKGLNDAIVVMCRLLGPENASLISVDMFWYYYKKCVKDKQI